MKFFIIGASGLVGGNFAAYLRSIGEDVVGTHLAYATETTVYYNTVVLNDELNFNVGSYNPDIIVHCGALTNVDYCELNPDVSYNKTFTSAANVALLSQSLNAKLIYISTDYVFDGISGPYSEEDTPNPINFYGKHKLAAENFIKENLSDYLITRVTNVYGDESRKKNFVSRLIQNIRNHQTIDIKLPIDQYATPINAMDIAKAVYLLILNNSVGTYHLSSTDYLNRWQLFNRVVTHFNFKKSKVELLTTNQMAQAARRPLRGGLLPLKFLKENPTFQFTNVDDYLKKMNNGSFAQV